MPLNKKALDI